MAAPQLLNDVLSLPLADRVDLLHRLRENLVAEASINDGDETHAILDTRLAAFERDGAVGASWNEVEARLRARLAKQ